MTDIEMEDWIFSFVLDIVCATLIEEINKSVEKKKRIEYLNKSIQIEYFSNKNNGRDEADSLLIIRSSCSHFNQCFEKTLRWVFCFI